MLTLRNQQGRVIALYTLDEWLITPIENHWTTVNKTTL